MVVAAVEDLEKRLSNLEEQVRILSPSLSSHFTEPDRSNSVLFDVLAVTESLFPCAPTLEMMTDPAEPQIRFVVINVEGRGDLNELLEKQIEWHRRLDALNIDYSGQFRLCVAPIL